MSLPRAGRPQRNSAMSSPNKKQLLLEPLWDPAIEMGVYGNRFRGISKIAMIGSICCGLLVFAAYRIQQAGAATNSFEMARQAPADLTLQLATSEVDVYAAIGEDSIAVPASATTATLQDATRERYVKILSDPAFKPQLSLESDLSRRVRQPQLAGGRWYQPPPSNVTAFAGLNATARAAIVRLASRQTQVADFILIASYTALHVLAAALLGQLHAAADVGWAHRWELKVQNHVKRRNSGSKECGATTQHSRGSGSASSSDSSGDDERQDGPQLPVGDADAVGLGDGDENDAGSDKEKSSPKDEGAASNGTPPASASPRTSAASSRVLPYRTFAAREWLRDDSSWRRKERCFELPPALGAVLCKCCSDLSPNENSGLGASPEGTGIAGADAGADGSASVRCGCGPELGSRSWVSILVFLAFVAGIADVVETATQWSILDVSARQGWRHWEGARAVAATAAVLGDRGVNVAETADLEAFVDPPLRYQTAEEGRGGESERGRGGRRGYVPEESTSIVVWEAVQAMESCWQKARQRADRGSSWQGYYASIAAGAAGAAGAVPHVETASEEGEWEGGSAGDEFEEDSLNMVELRPDGSVEENGDSMTSEQAMEDGSRPRIPTHRLPSHLLLAMGVMLPSDVRAAARRHRMKCIAEGLHQQVEDISLAKSRSGTDTTLMDALAARMSVGLLPAWQEASESIARHLPLLAAASRAKWMALAALWGLLGRALQAYVHPCSRVTRLAFLPRWLGSIRLLPASLLCIGAATIALGALPGVLVVVAGPAVLQHPAMDGAWAGLLERDEVGASDGTGSGSAVAGEQVLRSGWELARTERRLRQSIPLGAGIAACGLLCVAGHIVAVTAQLLCPVEAGFILKKQRRKLATTGT